MRKVMAIIIIIMAASFVIAAADVAMAMGGHGGHGGGHSGGHGGGHGGHGGGGLAPPRWTQAWPPARLLF